MESSNEEILKAFQENASDIAQLEYVAREVSRRIDEMELTNKKLKAENVQLKEDRTDLQVEYTATVGRHSRKNLTKLRICQNYPPHEPFYNACLSCVMLYFCRKLFKE